MSTRRARPRRPRWIRRDTRSWRRSRLRRSTATTRASICRAPAQGTPRSSSAAGNVGLLKPGIYYLKSGADIGGRLIGGYEPGRPGVAVMFDEAGPGNCPSCVLSGQSALTIALNVGTRFPPTYTGGARGDGGRRLGRSTRGDQWSGWPDATDPDDAAGQKDPTCTVPTSGPFVEPAACNASRNKTINVAGRRQASLFRGSNTCPTDNIDISGGSSGDGRVGQIIAWTLSYTGGTHITQEGAVSTRPGTLRLDGACTAPGTPCNP